MSKEKLGSEKIGIRNLIDILEKLESTTMPSALPVEIVVDNDGKLREIQKVEFYLGSLCIFV